MTFRRLAQPMAITGESPLWDATRQCLWWIDIQAQRLLRTTMDGMTEAIACPWQPGFVALGESGDLVLGLETGLWTLAPEAERWRHVTPVEAERPTVRLNDGKPDRHGRLFFGSMDMTGTGQALGRLYCRDTQGALHILREGITVPNAIVPFPDGSGLWFADSPLGTVEALTLSQDGRAITESRTVCRTPEGTHPDGACLAADGTLWIALIGSGEVLQVSPDGEVLARHPSPVTRATMPMLGGPDGQTLFLTNQRRFLSPRDLAAQPAAGGLLAKRVSNKAGAVARVAGL
ncbi:SMP-30/gluconolactonase/LRE family protein [Mameliella sp.]|uniref:SMP-30/gluconolactonase/LRE family protein n=1 Tax=Mameliella sp. TaxID=1924940 RepID=UPI003BAB23C7